MMAVDPALRQNHPEAAPFWDAAEKGIFVLPTCRACGRAHWYPRAFCPFCFSAGIDWAPSGGEGEIYSICNNRPAAGTDAVVYVRLDEGPTLLSHLVDHDPDTAAIGGRVKVVMKSGRNGEPFPVFRPL